MSVTQEYATARGLGTLERCLALDAELELPEGGTARAQLALTAQGVWLLAASAVNRGVAYELSRNPSLRYEARLFGDRVLVDGRELGVPLREGAEARQILGLGRLRGRARAGAAPPVVEGRYVEQDPGYGPALLASILQPGEQVLAWLLSSSDGPVEEPIGPSPRGLRRWLLTERRSLLVALTDLGDRGIVELPAEPLLVQKLVGRADRVSVRGIELQATLSNGALYEELAELPELSAPERLRRVARENANRFPATSQRLLLALGEHTEDLDRLHLALLSGEDCTPALTALREAGRDPEAVARSCDLWGYGPELLLHTVGRAVDAAPEHAAWLLPLHKLAWRLRQNEQLGSGARVAADLHLAEHFMLAGARDQAASLLRSALAALPDEQLADLLPPEDADLSAGEAGQLHRIRLLERLAWARGGPEAPDLETLVALARLQPLVASRMEQLAAASSGVMSTRAREVLELLRGLEPRDCELPQAPARALTEEQLRGLVQHPAARVGGVLSWLQTWLARQTAPDRRTLRSYCERVSPKRHQEALGAVADATLALGLPGLEAYVAHGDLGLGLRAYEDHPSYLLLGGQHLYDETPVWLRPTELRFAVGAELAHLRFGHARVTRAELWDGAKDKLLGALDLTATAISLGVWPQAQRLLGQGRASKLLEPLFSENTLGRITLLQKYGGSLSLVESTPRRWLGAQVAEAGSVGTRQAELLAAHRVMALTADRAGLVLCGDLRSALRAIFLTDPDLARELPIAERSGLAAALSRRDPKGHILHQDLAVRVAALLGFYLSEDYERLRAALA